MRKLETKYIFRSYRNSCKNTSCVSTHNHIQTNHLINRSFNFRILVAEFEDFQNNHDKNFIEELNVCIGI